MGKIEVAVLGQFEEWLKGVHWDQTDGQVFDDDLPDAFDDWISELTDEDWIKLGNDYALACSKDNEDTE